ncbi:hypothetical protein I3842_01G037800 [Carya illinoinensis]|uniref:Uncharacterized protein n=1 Tax=Carya illinoinensis TaxID=32201 RepID=A0A922G1A4_CARIL|nr:hypothetical protein I3842_01G037800 [Carya illinoinensis]
MALSHARREERLRNGFVFRCPSRHSAVPVSNDHHTP